MSNSKLDDLRRDIDALDSELLKLFQQRAEKAAEIYKAKGEGSPWRPAREAEHLRELCNQVRSAGGALTEQRVRRIWRAIYADSVASQSRLTIYAEQKHEATVRAHFGNAINFSPTHTAKEALANTDTANTSAVAAIAYEDWHLLIGSKELFVHEALYDEVGLAINWFVAKRSPEPSGQDWALVAIHLQNEVAVQSAMALEFKRFSNPKQEAELYRWRVWPGEEDTFWFLQKRSWQNPPKTKLEGEIDLHCLGIIPEQGKMLVLSGLGNE